jgi:MSHA biogenesis protein MshN
MSLINQVLQDLDRRRAGATALPAAAVRVAPAPAHDPARMLAGVLGAVLVAGAVAAASALLWRQVDANAAPMPAPALPAAAVGAAVWTRPAGDAIDFAAIANAGAAAVTLPATSELTIGAVADLAAPKVAAAPTAQTTGAAAMPSASASEAQPARVAIAARDAPPTAIPLPVQLDKSTPPPSPAERADLEYRHGIEAHRDARIGDAEAAFTAALQHDPRHASARRALAVEWIGRGRVADAERILAEGLALDPQQPQLAIVAARIQADRHDLPAAIEMLRASLGGSGAAPSDQAEAVAVMATLQQGAGQHREAVESFAAALRQMPQKGAWWAGLGLSLAAEGRGASAREAFERARATGTLAPELQLYVEQRLRSTTP